MKLYEGLIDDLAPEHTGTIAGMPATCSPFPPPQREPYGPGPTLGISTWKLDMFQIMACKPVCPRSDPGICLVFLHNVFRKRWCRSSLFLPQVFGRCTVFSLHMKIQFSRSFTSLIKSAAMPFILTFTFIFA